MVHLSRAKAAALGITVPDAGKAARGAKVKAGIRRGRLLLDAFDGQCVDLGLPVGHAEFMWHPRRKFRADRCWPTANLILELQGGGYVGGAHHRGQGFESDCSRMAQAVLLGYRVLYCTARQITKGQAALWVAELLERKP